MGSELRLNLGVRMCNMLETDLPCSMSLFARFVHPTQVLRTAGWALCGHETPAGQAQDDPVESLQCASQEEAAVLPQQLGTGCTEGSSADARPAATNCKPSGEPCTSVIQLSRGERVVLGQKCKRLIDAGREDWLLQQGFQARCATCQSSCVAFGISVQL